MGLSSALVDRARPISYEKLMRQLPDGSKVPIRVEGESQMEWVYGQWFDCRINSPSAPEAQDSAGGRDRVSQHPQMIYAPDDDDGNPVVLHDTMRVQVESDDFGAYTWRLVGEPTLYRKKTGIVCGEVTIERLLDRAPVIGRTSQVADAATQPVHVLPSGT